jgi:hypothetical protein
VENHGKH